ncbi:MAG TPA: iron-sulfur cluster biosynthesis protein [Pseudonocardiaceae bacterium]|jgi:Fe-S cluster assembly iron-binding protein IscA|nr:iron-sulfur cluster biosynthesis protein [Pseudonocardiaceae bacterium]
MLALTPAAVEVVSTITAASGLPDTAGLRIASTGEDPQSGGLELEIVPGPVEQDEVVAETGARIFLEPGAAAYLTDKVLDGQMDDQGRARFAVGPQDNNIVDGGGTQ